MEFTPIINPATGQQEAQYERLSATAAQEKVAQAHRAFLDWRNTSFAQRRALMHKLADKLEENKERCARLATQEMGKTIVQARKEIEKCVWVCRYYADNAENMLADTPVRTEAAKSYVTFMPMGVVLAVMPWNFPFYQVVRFAAPALMAGNTGALKHASNVQGCALALETMIREAGFPEGAFINLNVGASQVKALIENPHIAAVTLTGSDPAGRSVAAIAGQNLKKTVLELGGSDAYLVLDDADPEEAAETLAFGRLQNNGQTCIAVKRIVVDRSLYEDFLSRFCKKMAAAKMGDPMDENTYYGPMARVDLRDEIHEQTLKSVAQGSRLMVGGVVPEGEGAYYPATVLADVAPGMEAFDNELFGPVASVVRADDEDHAIALANRSQFGLGSGVITKDRARGERVARKLEAGSAFVNKLVASDPRMPFGGVKNSGYGRELSQYGLREFVNVKSIWIS